MGTLPLSTEQDSPPSSDYQAQTMAPFPEIKSTHSLTAKHVTAEKWAKLVITSPRPLASPWPRLLLAPLNSITNIAVSMLVTKIPTLTSLMFLTPSSANTMVLVLISSTPLTWMPPKSPPTLNPMSQFTPAESVSAVPSKDSVFPPASPSNNVLMLRPS